MRSEIQKHIVFCTIIAILGLSGCKLKEVTLTAYIPQLVKVGKPGFSFYIDEKWKQKSKKLGTLTVSVGGLRWRPWKGKSPKWWSWNKVIKKMGQESA